MFTPTLLEKYKHLNKINVTTVIGIGQVTELSSIILVVLLTELVGRKPLVVFGFFVAGCASSVLPIGTTVPVLAAGYAIQQATQTWAFISVIVSAIETPIGN